MPILRVGATDIPYEVRYSKKAKRKRIIVTPDGVEVVAPKGTPLQGAGGVVPYVQGRRRWVFDSVREIEAKHRKLLTQTYASGAKLQYRGRWLMLDVSSGPVQTVEIACRSKFHVTVPEELDRGECPAAIRDAFNRWLRERADRDLQRFGRRHAASLGVRAEGFRLSDSSSRWGSCGRDGVVRVHWRLIQAPSVAMEYVVAHEVVHLIHRNHSPEFWRVLASGMPEWAAGKAMLEEWEGAHRAV